MKELLKELCLLCGVSGNENAVREYIIDKIKDICEYSVDPLGSIICLKKGKRTPDKKLMICAHMDEVGFIVTSVSEDGTLSFGTVGGVDASVAIGRQVLVGERRLPGVVGSAAVHNLPTEERDKAPKIKDMYIDIGADSRDEALRLVSPGDCVYFVPDFEEMGESRVKCKAIDDRAGCAVMLRLMQEEHEYDTWYVFNVQEEIGLRGSGASAFSVAPDLAVVLEATTAADIDGVSGEKRVCALGSGPVVSFMDRSTVYDRELFRLAFDIAGKEGLPCQTKSLIAGGNDAGAIHISRKGVRTIAVSVPCRYLHSASCLADMNDIENTYRLVRSLTGGIYRL